MHKLIPYIKILGGDEHMDFSKCTSLLAIALEILSNSNKPSIIKLPKSVKYNLPDTLNVILHAATSATNSPESASNDLKQKNPDKNIPSSDSINKYINYAKCGKRLDCIVCFFSEIRIGVTLKMKVLKD